MNPLYDYVSSGKAVANNKIVNIINRLGKGESAFFTRKQLIAFFGNTYYSIINSAFYNSFSIKHTSNGNLIITRFKDKEKPIRIDASVKQHIHHHSVVSISEMYPVYIEPYKIIIYALYHAEPKQIILSANSIFCRITQINQYRNKRKLFTTELTVYPIYDKPTHNLFFENLDVSKLDDDSYIVELINNQPKINHLFWDIDCEGNLVAIS
jgi:hypothetical protein